MAVQRKKLMLAATGEGLVAVEKGVTFDVQGLRLH